MVDVGTRRVTMPFTRTDVRVAPSLNDDLLCVHGSNKHVVARHPGREEGHLRCCNATPVALAEKKPPTVSAPTARILTRRRSHVFASVQVPQPANGPDDVHGLLSSVLLVEGNVCVRDHAERPCQMAHSNPRLLFEFFQCADVVPIVPAERMNQRLDLRIRNARRYGGSALPGKDDGQEERSEHE
jgi:hypothetical protein